MKPYIIALTSLLLCAMAHAEIYEIIDANGRKTYSDKPPHDQPDARPLEVAPHTGNAWHSDSQQQQNDQYYEQLKQRQDSEQKRKLAEEQLEQEREQSREEAIREAEEQLEEARELKAGDYYPNSGQRGLRYTQEYRDRVKQAEEALEKARSTNSDEE